MIDKTILNAKTIYTQRDCVVTDSLHTFILHSDYLTIYQQAWASRDP